MAATLGNPLLDWRDLRHHLGYTGIGIRKLTPDDQKTMLAELDKEKEA
ncbi:MAG: hypothetical protein M3Z49_09225 [Bifidobacteriales bacterium]|nr:hypothetical protein [Bifidobacteriales bacterium]